MNIKAIPTNVALRCSECSVVLAGVPGGSLLFAHPKVEGAGPRCQFDGRVFEPPVFVMAEYGVSKEGKKRI